MIYNSIVPKREERKVAPMFYCYKVKWWNESGLENSEGLLNAHSLHEAMEYLEGYYGVDEIMDCRLAAIDSDFNVDDNGVLPFEEFDVCFNTFIKE